MQASMGLSYLSSITSHFLNVLQWWFFIYFYCMTVKMIWSFQCDFNPLSNVTNALGNIANAFKNNYSLWAGSLVWVGNRGQKLSFAAPSPLPMILHPNKWACSQAKIISVHCVSNRLKNVVTHFQCIFQHIFNAFST